MQLDEDFLGLWGVAVVGMRRWYAASRLLYVGVLPKSALFGHLLDTLV